MAFLEKTLDGRQLKMRIISGKLKGRSIMFLKKSTTRPLKDSVKENIFNILEHSNLIHVNIKDSIVLDLYSGFGSFGLEIISRGANKVTFVEKNNGIMNTIRKSLDKFSIINKALIINDSVENFLNKDNKNKFDIFFLDPPYSEKFLVNDLNLIKKNNMFKKNHIIIIHRETESRDELEDLINILIVKNYRRSKIIFGTFG